MAIKAESGLVKVSSSLVAVGSALVMANSALVKTLPGLAAASTPAADPFTVATRTGETNRAWITSGSNAEYPWRRGDHGSISEGSQEMLDTALRLHAVRVQSSGARIQFRQSNTQGWGTWVTNNTGLSLFLYTDATTVKEHAMVPRGSGSNLHPRGYTNVGGNFVNFDSVTADDPTIVNAILGEGTQFLLVLASSTTP